MSGRRCQVGRGGRRVWPPFALKSCRAFFFFLGEALRSDPPSPPPAPQSLLLSSARSRAEAGGVAWLGTAPSSGLQWMTAPPPLPGATQLHKCFSFLRRYVHNTGSRRDSEVPVKAGKKKKFSKLNQSGKVILARPAL